MVERRAHRDWVGVVAVVHQDDPIAHLEALAPKAGEAYIRSAIGHLGKGRAEGDARGDGGQRVGQVVCLGEGKLEGLATRRRLDQRLGDAVRDPALSRGDVATGAEAQQARRRGQVWLQLAAVSRHDRRPVGRQRRQHLGLRRRDRLDRAEQLDVDRADVGDHRHFRLGDRGQLGDLAGPAHRHLQHQDVGVVGGLEHGQRQPDLGVEVLRVGVDAAGQEGAGDVLDRGLADRAGDADDAGAERPPPVSASACSAASGSSTANTHTPLSPLLTSRFVSLSATKREVAIGPTTTPQRRPRSPRRRTRRR